MKIIILCLLCGFLCLGCADKEEGSFTITGQMKGLSGITRHSFFKCTVLIFKAVYLYVKMLVTNK